MAAFALSMAAWASTKCVGQLKVPDGVAKPSAMARTEPATINFFIGFPPVGVTVAVNVAFGKSSVTVRCASCDSAKNEHACQRH